MRIATLISVSSTMVRRSVASLFALLVGVSMASAMPLGTFNMETAYSDVNVAPTIGGIAGFNGTSFFSPAGVGEPVDVLETAFNSGLFTFDFSDTVFEITSGFNELQTYVIDTNLSNSLNSGDDLLSTIGQGAFVFKSKSTGNTILSGSFVSGTFSSKVGGNGGTFSTSDVGGLDLVAGPGFNFGDGTWVADILDSESFAFNLVGITRGVTASQTAVLVPGAGGIFTADLQSIDVATGGVNTSGQAVVVPDPVSATLAGLGLLALVATTRRRS